MRKNKLNILQYFMCIFCLSVVTISCSTSTSNSDLQSLTKYTNEVKSIFNAIPILKDDLEKPSSILRTNDFLDQETLNYYLSLVGLDSDYVSLNDLNQIITVLSETNFDDFEASIEDLQYTPLTKGALNQMASGQSYNSLNDIDGFSELDISEKEILTLSNEVVKEYNTRLYDDTIQVPCPSDACTVMLIIAGASIGSSICGLPCGIVGGFVGLLIGSSMKNN